MILEFLEVSALSRNHSFPDLSRKCINDGIRESKLNSEGRHRTETTHPSFRFDSACNCKGQISFPSSDDSGWKLET